MHFDFVNICKASFISNDLKLHVLEYKQCKIVCSVKTPDCNFIIQKKNEMDGIATSNQRT